MTDDPVALEARTDATRVCPHCQKHFEMPAKRPGRRPVWCSAKCRRAASAHRLAAAAAGTPVTVVEVPRAHRPDVDARLPIPSMATLTRLFLSSDYQCRTLLEALEHRYAHDGIDGQLRAVVERFAATVSRHRTLSDDPDYHQARAEVERLRDQLRRDAQRHVERDQELTRLRGEAAQVWVLRARITELETTLATTSSSTGTAVDAGPSGPAGPAGLSRQQRRAAARATGKHH